MSSARIQRFYAWNDGQRDSSGEGTGDVGEDPDAQLLAAEKADSTTIRAGEASQEVAHTRPRQRAAADARRSPPATDQTVADRVLIGKGKYGSVFREKDGVVVKEVKAKVSDRGLGPPFREKIVAILQSLLVVSRISPNFPLHYGFDIGSVPVGGKIDLSYYIEEFDGSLDVLGSQVMLPERPNSWITSSFQMFSAIATYAVVLSIAHNDLYPRNILAKRLRRPGTTFVYNIFGNRFVVEVDYVLAVTDFGICSSPLLGGTSTSKSPEVAATLKEEPRCSGAPFGTLPPKKHILHYKFLPVYSRDVYLVLKWIAFATKSFPRAPPQVVSWAKKALDWVDRHEEHFEIPNATTDFIFFAFSPEVLTDLSLQTLRGKMQPTDEEERVTRAVKRADNEGKRIGGNDVVGTTVAAESTGKRKKEEVFNLDDGTRVKTMEEAKKILDDLHY